MSVTVRNTTGEDRVCASLGWVLIPDGESIEVEDEDAYHWAAGGWTVEGSYPVPHHLYPNHASDLNAFALPAPEQAETEDPAPELPPAPADEPPAEPEPVDVDQAPADPAEEITP